MFFLEKKVETIVMDSSRGVNVFFLLPLLPLFHWKEGIKIP